MNLFQAREVDTNEITIPFEVQPGLFSASNVNLANFASWNVRRKLSSHSTYLILTTVVRLTRWFIPVHFTETSSTTSSFASFFDDFQNEAYPM